MKVKIMPFLVVAAILAVLTVGLVSCDQAGTASTNPAAGVSPAARVGTDMSLEESNNRVAVAATHVAAVGLGEMLKNVTEENQRAETVRKFIDPIRFFADKTGYFYVYYYNCVNLAHAIDKTLPGKNLTDYQDMKGKYVIRELSAASRDGGGFVIFYWPHPATKVEQRKIGYVEPIPGTDYFIGTGYYPDTK
jgi:signal transduction histidine kinase